MTATTTTITTRRPPKRARTAYFIFADEVRSEIQREHPGEGVGTQAKRIGARWQSISEPEKDRFKNQAASEKEVVVAALAAYKEQFGDALLEEGSETMDSSSDLVFPVARIRKIAKLDPEVKSLSKEALQLVVKSAELALAKLGKESVKVARIQNRRTLLPDDVSHVCSHQEAFRFLKDDIKDLAKILAKQKEENKNHQAAAAAFGASSDAASASAATVTKKEAARVAAAVGSKPLTSYFGAVASKK
jgi:histone H3/H4